MGFPLPVIAKLLDHESLETTEIYAEMINAAFRDMEDSLQKLHQKIFMVLGVFMVYISFNSHNIDYVNII